VIRFVIDANVAIKWVVGEAGTEQALALLKGGRLCAPDLIVAECANILWKKAARGELTAQSAIFNARILESSDLEIVSTRHLFAAATEIAIRLDHPAYDCLYLALARERALRLATADDRLLTRLSKAGFEDLSALAISLPAAAAAIPGEGARP